MVVNHWLVYVLQTNPTAATADPDTSFNSTNPVDPLDESFQPGTSSSSTSSDSEEEKTAQGWQEPKCIVYESKVMELMKFYQTSCHCPKQDEAHKLKNIQDPAWNIQPTQHS
jgi:hypothetical protein